MAYGLKYYAYFNHPSGGQVRLEIYENGYSGSNYQIANVQGLSLEIGGGSEPIYTPVVKTTLRFSVADAFDVGTRVGDITCVTTEGGIETKNGQWEEFYTNDPLLYKVVLKHAGNTIWQGFITPDSWQEAMVYRGTITVVARDMLGTLSDITFNPTAVDGTVSVGDLIAGAVTASNAAMSLVPLNGSDAPRNRAADVSIFAARINVAAFEDKSWWEALTGTLEALGLAMRYNGANGWRVVAVRYLPDIVSSFRACEFTDRSGLRTLDPPVRDIDGTFTVESQEYGLQPYDGAELTADNYQGNVYSRGGAGGAGTNVAHSMLAHNSGSWAAKQSSSIPSLLYKPDLPVTQALKDAGFVSFAPMYFIANTSSSPDGDWDQTKLRGEAALISGRIKAAAKLIIREDGIILTQSDTALSVPTATGTGQLGVAYAELLITATVSGTTYYLTNDGEWVSQETYYRLEFAGGQGAVDIIAPEGVDEADYAVTLAYIRVNVDQVWYPSTTQNWHGYFVPLAVLLDYPDGANVAREYNVQTIYNEDYNVRITRTPALGCVDTALAGPFLKNALLLGDAPIADRWGWAGDNIDVPLEVLVQMQLLQFYAASASIFTGTLRDKGRLALPGDGYAYFQRNCLLMRGTFDFTNGRLLDAAMREFYTWSNVWGGTQPEWTRRTKGDARDGGSGGGSSSGGGGGTSTESYANTMAIASMRARIEALEGFWDKDSDGNIFAKNQAGVYSYSFVSAGGKGTPGGGGGGGADVQLSVSGGVATLVVNGTTAAMYTKADLDGRLGTAAFKGVGAVASGNTDLVTGGAVYAAIQAHGGEANVQSNWAETNTNSDAYIKNKPDLSVFARKSELSDYVTAQALASTLSGYVTLATAQNNITGQKTFTQRIIASGGLNAGGTIQMLGKDVLTAYTESGGTPSPLLIGYGTCAERQIRYYAKTSHTFSVYKEGQSDPTWNLVLALQDTALYAYRNLEPGSDGERNLGASSLRWNNLHAKRWYPNGANGPYIEFDTTANAFHIVGAVYADSFVTAGGANPNA